MQPWTHHLLSLCLLGAALPAMAGETLATLKSEHYALRVERFAEGLANPWGAAFLPDGRMLVTEREGRLRLIDKDGKVSTPLAGLPAIAVTGQGGLLDVAVDPAFAQNRTVYLSFAEPRGGRTNSTSVLRAKLGDNGLSEVKVIFRQQPAIDSALHFGSRLAFAPDGKLFITTGDRYSQKKRAQTLDNHLGKVIRVNSDGSVPSDNPFVKREGALPEIWSYGHRNLQGAAIHPQTGQLWTNEHGAKGGDEVNLTQAGRNYGWPVITWGVDYSGAKIGEGTTKSGMEQPLHYWVPSIATSGMAFYGGQPFAKWRGNLLVGGLRGQMLARLELDGTRIVSEERLLTEIKQRIRDVRVGPDGLIYLLTDEAKGSVLRVSPQAN
ncbi:PQQ-dependent sugar dehydrogenase [Chitinimonas sp. BJYL2]|uniref:PQQ-dependent sugar dehydrogenase n=1 Tax=Chitinimonas sp. BJYL2 TaxID=2976696 RepID=UPI0022B4A677|nr:PQQ-dependent sugar dehydrogenase [Chitinimonas sp. BJYL2]